MTQAKTSEEIEDMLKQERSKRYYDFNEVLILENKKWLPADEHDKEIMEYKKIIKTLNKHLEDRSIKKTKSLHQEADRILELQQKLKNSIPNDN